MTMTLRGRHGQALEDSVLAEDEGICNHRTTDSIGRGGDLNGPNPCFGFTFRPRDEEMRPWLVTICGQVTAYGRRSAARFP
jgi:hypothetical protein